MQNQAYCRSPSFILVQGALRKQSTNQDFQRSSFVERIVSNSNSNGNQGALIAIVQDLKSLPGNVALYPKTLKTFSIESLCTNLTVKNELMNNLLTLRRHWYALQRTQNFRSGVREASNPRIRSSKTWLINKIGMRQWFGTCWHQVACLIQFALFFGTHSIYCLFWRYEKKRFLRTGGFRSLSQKVAFSGRTLQMQSKTKNRTVFLL